MTRFEILDQLGGVGLKGYGRTLEELFGNLALGMFGLVAEVTVVQPMASVPILAQAETLEALLVAWLNELLRAAARDQFLFMNCRVHNVTPVPVDNPAGAGEPPILCISGEATGEVLDPSRHPLSRTIKVVTGHESGVRHVGDQWVAQVTFGL